MSGNGKSQVKIQKSVAIRKRPFYPHLKARGKPTWNKGIYKNPNFCKDCGKKIQPKPRLRCFKCWQKFVIKRREEKKPKCIDCGTKCSYSKKKVVRCLKCNGKYRIKMKFNVGEKNWRWNGGVSKFRNRVRSLPEYREWRSKIFKRDNYTCVLCGGRGYLEADHYPIPFVILLKKAIEIYGKNIDKVRSYNPFWDINNGRTTCKKDNRKLYFGNQHEGGILND